MKTVKALKTSNANFLVKFDNGTIVYLTSEYMFIRFADVDEWNWAIDEWELESIDLEIPDSLSPEGDSPIDKHLAFCHLVEKKEIYDSYLMSFGSLKLDEELQIPDYFDMGLYNCEEKIEDAYTLRYEPAGNNEYSSGDRDHLMVTPFNHEGEEYSLIVLINNSWGYGEDDYTGSYRIIKGNLVKHVKEVKEITDKYLLDFACKSLKAIN